MNQEAMPFVNLLTTRIINVVDPLLAVIQWIVFAITVSRVYQKDVFGRVNMSKLSDNREGNKSTSNEGAGEPGSRTNTVHIMRDKSLQVMWIRRLLCVGGYLLAVSIRAVDPLATRFDDFIYVNIACTLFSALFGTIWVGLFAYNHVCAYHVAVCGLHIPEGAPRAHRNFEIGTVISYAIFVPLAVANRRALFVGIAFIVCSFSALLFALVLLFTVNALYMRLSHGPIASMVTSGQSHESRAKKLRRFYIIGNTMAVVLLIAAVSGVLSGTFCILDKAHDLADLDPLLLTIIVWNGNIASYIGLTVIQWIQWDRKESADRPRRGGQPATKDHAGQPAAAQDPPPTPTRLSIPQGTTSTTMRASSTQGKTEDAPKDELYVPASHEHAASELRLEVPASEHEHEHNGDARGKHQRMAAVTRLSSEDLAREIESAKVSILSTLV